MRLSLNTSLGLLALWLCGGRAGAASVERRIGLMGTELRVEVESVDHAAALAASERAVRAVEAAERRLSTWRRDSELGRVNAAPVGLRVPVSRHLAAELVAARRCWHETDGAFDPTVGPLVEAWGLRTGGRWPPLHERRAALAATGMGGLRLGAGWVLRRRPELVIEEGGFGKGAALAAAVAVLAEDPRVHSALLDLGGQLALVGDHRGRSLALAHPRARKLPAVRLEVDSGSLATSGNAVRAVNADGRRIGHLIDPRTGAPAADFGSLTVWTTDPLRADCLSTGLYVAGPEEALRWAAAVPGVEVLVLEDAAGERLVARATAGLASRSAALWQGLEWEVWGRSGTAAR